MITNDSGVGDFIVQTALIREVRRVYPESEITLMVSPPAFNLAEICPYVDEVIVNRENFSFGNDFISLYRWCVEFSRRLLEKRIDICYAVAHSPGTPLIMYMSGARVRISHLISNDIEACCFANTPVPMSLTLNLATNRFPLLEYGDHAVDICLSLLDHTLNSPVANRSIEIWYKHEELEQVKSLLRNLGLKDLNQPLYALTMGGTWLKKHYPPEKYARVIEMILNEEPDARFVILGGGNNDLISARIVENTIPEIYRNKIIDLTNKISYRQSAAALTLCDMYIGNDTGTTHCAEAMKVPVLMPKCFPLDLPTSPMDSPRLWYPYGVPSVTIQPEHALPGCTSSNKAYDHWGCRARTPHCITQIQPETVFRGFKLLKERIEQKRIAQKINQPLYIH